MPFLVVVLALTIAFAQENPRNNCTTDDDCSLNGVCDPKHRVCACSRAWSGARCSELQLQPANLKDGLWASSNGRPISSWGGSVVPFGSHWYMFSSLMTQHCGINSWTENSKIVLATSPSAGAAYQLYGGNEANATIFPIFSHEPNVVLVPKGAPTIDGARLAMFFTMHSPSGRPVCACSDGSTDDPSCPGTNDEGATYVSWAKAPNGPWAKPVELIQVGKRGSDTNLSPVIRPDGSLVGLWRTWRQPPYNGSEPRLVTATDWREASTYNFHQDDPPLFAEIAPEHPAPKFAPSMGAEDPHVCALVSLSLSLSLLSPCLSLPSSTHAPHMVCTRLQEASLCPCCLCPCCAPHVHEHVMRVRARVRPVVHRCIRTRVAICTPSFTTWRPAQSGRALRLPVAMPSPETASSGPIRAWPTRRVCSSSTAARSRFRAWSGRTWCRMPRDASPTW